MQKARATVVDSAAWSEVVDGLSAEQRRALVTSVADNVLEGWQPTAVEVQLLADYAAGRITAEQYRAAVLEMVSA